MTFADAYTIGINACADAIGRDLFDANKSNTVFAGGNVDGKVFCFVGVFKEPMKTNKTLALDSTSKWPYSARCMVNPDTGEISELQVNAKNTEIKE